MVCRFAASLALCWEDLWLEALIEAIFFELTATTLLGLRAQSHCNAQQAEARYYYVNLGIYVNLITRLYD
jgi:hypothetical protein